MKSVFLLPELTVYLVLYIGSVSSLKIIMK